MKVICVDDVYEVSGGVGPAAVVSCAAGAATGLAVSAITSGGSMSTGQAAVAAVGGCVSNVAGATAYL
jgi:lactobin A/cerein 7B family class IIb bacteriocin